MVEEVVRPGLEDHVFVMLNYAEWLSEITVIATNSEIL
jgi:hypothetical protein